jgi:hypothetical protein
MMKIADIPKLRLINQQLIHSQMKTPKEALRWMCAIQAQDYKASLNAVCARLIDTSSEDVEAAFAHGDFLRTHVLRPTWHLVPAEDIRWMLQLTGPRIKTQATSWWRTLGLGETDLEKSNIFLKQALSDGQHLTRAELVGMLEDAGIDASGHRITQMLFHAEVDAIVCSGTPKSGKQTYALLDDRAPETKKHDRETSLAMLAKRYFTSRGPATLKDFTWWSGLKITEARQALLMVQKDFSSADIDGQTYYFNHVLREVEIPSGTVHRLPAFDEYIIAYADRSAVIAAEHSSKAIYSNGIFRPTILRDGIVVGTWKTVGKQIEESYF